MKDDFVSKGIGMASFTSESASVLTAPITQRAAVGQQAWQVLSLWWVAFGASSLLVVGGHLLIKFGLNVAVMHGSRASLLGLLLHLLAQSEVIIGLVIYCLGSICWIAAVAQQEISFLYPLSSINYVLVVVTSSVFFHEWISLRRAAGVVVIVVGMFLMKRSKAEVSQ